MTAFWRGFWSVWMYAGAYLILAPLWDQDWERPMKRLLRTRDRDAARSAETRMRLGSLRTGKPGDAKRQSPKG